MRGVPLRMALLVLAIARLGTGEEVEALDHADTYEDLSDSEEAVHMDEEHNEEYDHEESDEDALRRAQEMYNEEEEYPTEARLEDIEAREAEEEHYRRMAERDDEYYEYHGEL